MVFAIGNEQDDAVRGALRRERVHGGLQRLRNGRAAARNNAGIQIIERHGERGIIHGQRALHDGGTRKRHEAHAVTAQVAQQIAHAPLGLLQARGLDVRRQHRARCIQYNHQIQALAADFLPMEAPLRAGERNNQKHQRRQPQRQPRPRASGIPRRRQRGQCLRRHKAVDGAPPPLQQGQQQRCHRRQQEQGKEHFSVAPLQHGRPPRRV